MEHDARCRQHYPLNTHVRQRGNVSAGQQSRLGDLQEERQRQKRIGAFGVPLSATEASRLEYG